MCRDEKTHAYSKSERTSNKHRSDRPGLDCRAAFAATDDISEDAASDLPDETYFRKLHVPAVCSMNRSVAITEQQAAARLPRICIFVRVMGLAQRAEVGKYLRLSPQCVSFDLIETDIRSDGG